MGPPPPALSRITATALRWGRLRPHESLQERSGGAVSARAQTVLGLPNHSLHLHGLYRCHESGIRPAELALAEQPHLRSRHHHPSEQFIRLGSAGNQREVFLLDGVVLELMGKMALCIGVPGKDHHAAGLLVQPMHDQQFGCELF